MTAPVRTRRHVPWLLGLAGLVIAVDQLTKTWAINHVSDRSRHVFWTLRLAVTYNSGAAFSIGRGVAPFFVAAAGVMVVVLFLFARRDQSVPTTVALGLVLGGAVGNLSDRIFRHHAGSVIDFVDFRWWPVFNVADACIVTGAILLAVSARTHRSGTP